MILASECNGPVKNHPTSYLFKLTPEEYEQLMKGKLLTKVTGCATVSGTFELRFKKNSAKKHQELYG